MCNECAADVHPGTACRSRCEKDVEELNLVHAKHITSYAKAAKAYKRNAIGMLILALVFIALGILPVIMNDQYGLVICAVMGFVYLLWAFFSYRSAKQMESSKK